MIIVPFVAGRLEPATREWGQAHGAEFVDLTGDEFGYFNALSALWRLLPVGEPLAVVEHDVVPDDPAWRGLWACHEPWCVQPYPVSSRGDMAGDSLGCVRWSGALRGRLPELFDYIARLTIGQVPPRSWRVLDIYVRRELQCRGVRVHPHGRATHLHRYDD